MGRLLLVDVLIFLAAVNLRTACSDAEHDVAQRLGAHFGSRCDLEVVECTDAQGGLISQRLRSSAAPALLLRNCSDARVFPLRPTSWQSVMEVPADTQLKLTIQSGSRAQLGPALAEAGPQAVCTGADGAPAGYRGYCALAKSSPITEVALHNYATNMAKYLPAWGFYGPEGLVPSDSLFRSIIRYNDSAMLREATGGPFNSGLVWQHVLSLGPRLAEFAYHQHMVAWLKVEQGRKVVLTQPHSQTPSLALLARPPSESLAELLHSAATVDGNTAGGSSTARQEIGGDPNAKLCVMTAGDVLWLPAMQWHATMNLEDTIAIGGQAEPASLSPDDWEAVTLDMEAESMYCNAETEAAGDLVLTAIRSFTWCKQCAAAGRPARGLRAAQEYLSRTLLGWDNKERREVSENDAQLAVLLLEDCVDSLVGQIDSAKVRRWGWQEAWKRWPGWDPLGLQLRRSEL
jgi:hypothetical protein